MLFEGGKKVLPEPALHYLLVLVHTYIHQPTVLHRPVLRKSCAATEMLKDVIKAAQAEAVSKTAALSAIWLPMKRGQ